MYVFRGFLFFFQKKSFFVLFLFLFHLPFFFYFLFCLPVFFLVTLLVLFFGVLFMCSAPAAFSFSVLFSRPQLIKNGSRIKCNHGELRTDRCPWSIDRLFKLSYTHISDITTAGSRHSSSLSSPASSSQDTVTPTEYPASTRSLEYEWHQKSTETRRVDQKKAKIQIK